VRTPIKAACVLCALALFAARAEDIDIFTAGAGTAVRPNVLIVLDNSSNWSATFGPNSCNASTTKFAAEICALSQVALGLDENVRLGLMMFAETGENGGYVRFGARDMNPRNRTALATMVQNFVPQGAGADSSGSNQPYGKAMYEAFKYFGGYTSPAHANDDVGGSPLDRAHFGTAALAGWTTDEGGDIGARRRDYAGNTSGGVGQATGNRAAVTYGADNNAALADQATKTYTPPGINACTANGSPFVSSRSHSAAMRSACFVAAYIAIRAPLTALGTLSEFSEHVSNRRPRVPLLRSAFAYACAMRMPANRLMLNSRVNASSS